ncbi:ComF family protein [Marinobacter antarcticus]|uniref:ComF family protein n=3 Tax=root TaxID=1 RepID=A0A831R4Y5_9GAMM|nr:ComF family protein [Marinobacter antarcticus]HEA54018.1 ComF family protein [Marinobacter antarcticus]
MIKTLGWLSTLNRLKVDTERKKDRCIACLSPNGKHGLCAPCRADLPVNKWHCRCCALPLAHPSDEYLCGDCLTSPPPYDRSLIPWRYQYPVDSMISRYKYNGQRKFARPLLADFSDYLELAFEGQSDAKPDLLIPSPMFPARRRERGFNQARDIAESLGRALSIPVDAGVVRRVRKVQAQRGLSREARLANLRGVFNVCSSVPERVAIVDDVVTTGATVRVLASALREAGARNIQVWALARTPG